MKAKMMRMAIVPLGREFDSFMLGTSEAVT